MQNFYIGHIPEYMDDRIAITIVLSDDLHYRVYDQVESYTVSSWYDPTVDRAFTTTKYNDVPTEFRSSLIQHSTATGTATVMYPSEPIDTKASTSKTFSFPRMPEFEGDNFTIAWDVGRDDDAIYTYSRTSTAANLTHEYSDYGEHIIKFSSNVTGINLGNTLERIVNISSRSPNLKKINYFSYCRNLKSLELNTLSNITNQQYDCYELTSMYLPDLEVISNTYAVNCMYNLREFYAPNLKAITRAVGVFKGNVSLEKIDFPNLTSISHTEVKGYTFMTNVSLSSAYLPKLVSAMPSEFSYCVNLKETNFSSLSAVENNMFRDCISLKTISLPKIKRIGSSAFYRCLNLQTIDLSNVKEVPTLDNINAFTGLPTTYEILVNAQLFSSYQIATNWKSAKVKTHLKQV